MNLEEEGDKDGKDGEVLEEGSGNATPDFFRERVIPPSAQHVILTPDGY